MIVFKKLKMKDIDLLAPLYVKYFNTCEDMSWNEENARRKLKQLIKRFDFFGLKMEVNEKAIGFAGGVFTQLDNKVVFNLDEIFICKIMQNKGYGSMLLKEIEKRVKEKGTNCIYIKTNDENKSNNFFNERHGYTNYSRNILKEKAL